MTSICMTGRGGLLFLCMIVLRAADAQEAALENDSTSRCVTIATVAAKVGDGHAITLEYDARSIPFRYSCALTTPVCTTGECYVVEVNIYWDLTGAYCGFDLPAGKVLTKRSHDKFTQSDYDKLDAILGDAEWTLANYPIESLIVDKTVSIPEIKTFSIPEIKTVSIPETKVDGYSGATSSFVTEEDSVSGALFTVHVLWHFVHRPEIERVIRANTLALLDSGKIGFDIFLKSEREQYWDWCVDQLDAEHLDTEISQMLTNLLPRCNSFLGYKILKLLDATSLEMQMFLWDTFKKVSVEKKRNIVDKLTACSLHEEIAAQMNEYRETCKNPLERFLLKLIADKAR